MEKLKSLFDHISEIREGKSSNYYDDLIESEQKAFNQYVILIGLSMDIECIDEVSYISKYIDIIPNKQFYKMCCDIIPYGRKFSKWIKSRKDKINNELLEYISTYYKVGKDDATEYCEIMIASEKGLVEINRMLAGYGLTDKEIKKICKH